MSAESRRLADVLRAEVDGEDLEESECGNRIEVLAKKDDGTFYSIGSIDASTFLTNTETGWATINAIKFR